jgi:hypothetical protein
MVSLRNTGLLLVLVSSLVACGGGGSSGGTAINPWVGTWGIAGETDTFNPDNTLVVSTGGCTYTGGTYLVSGSTLTITAAPTAAVPSGNIQAATCSATSLPSTYPYPLNYSASYTITPVTDPNTGNLLTTGSLLTLNNGTAATPLYSLTGKWNTASLHYPLSVAGFGATLTLNADGTYLLSVVPSTVNGPINGSCDMSGGTYTASGESMTMYPPTQVTATGPAATFNNQNFITTDCKLAVLDAFQNSATTNPVYMAPLVNWISISQGALTVTDILTVGNTPTTYTLQ